MSARRRQGGGNQFDQRISPAGLNSLDSMIFNVVRAAEGSSLAIKPGDGAIQLGDKFIISPTGLQLVGQPTEQEWEEAGTVLRRIQTSLQWLIGDWFLVAESQWGKTYEAVASLTGYKEKTLREYAYVARNVHLSIRMDKLSFGHHQLVAGMDLESQRVWLSWALENNVSVAFMRKEIARANGETSPTPPAEFKQLKRDISYMFDTWDKVEQLSADSRVNARKKVQAVRDAAQRYLDRLDRAGR